MNNEPVAWMRKDGTLKFQEGMYFEVGQAFYTHPAKTLTDDEIIATVKDHFIGAIKVGIVLTNDNVLEFARAILRKAQEK